MVSGMRMIYQSDKSHINTLSCRQLPVTWILIKFFDYQTWPNLHKIAIKENIKTNKIDTISSGQKYLNMP